MARRTYPGDNLEPYDRLYAAVVKQALADLHEPGEAEASQWFLAGSTVLALYEERQANAAQLHDLYSS